MEKEKEDLRLEFLIRGIEHEKFTESQRAWMTSSMSLPVLPTDGKVVGGPGFDLKMEAYYTFLEALLPYVPVKRPEQAVAETPEVQDTSRNELVNQYKEMVASGEL